MPLNIFRISPIAPQILRIIRILYSVAFCSFLGFNFFSSLAVKISHFLDPYLSLFTGNSDDSKKYQTLYFYIFHCFPLNIYEVASKDRNTREFVLYPECWEWEKTADFVFVPFWNYSVSLPGNMADVDWDLLYKMLWINDMIPIRFSVNLLQESIYFYFPQLKVEQKSIYHSVQVHNFVSDLNIKYINT